MTDEPMNDERRHLAAIDEVVQAVVARYAGGGSALAAVRRSFSEMAGPGWGDARPVRIDGATLVVEVPSGSLATNLRFDAPRVVAGLVAAGLAPGVTAIRLRVARGPAEGPPDGSVGLAGEASGL
jgi:hypothetical protein